MVRYKLCKYCDLKSFIECSLEGVNKEYCPNYRGEGLSLKTYIENVLNKDYYVAKRRLVTAGIMKYTPSGFAPVDKNKFHAVLKSNGYKTYYIYLPTLETQKEIKEALANKRSLKNV